MAETDNKLEFFSDIKDKLLLIAAGLLSMATIVPLFINNIRGVFNLSVKVSFDFFLFAYFFVPLIFYLLYCSIHDYVGFLQLVPQIASSKYAQGKWRKVLIEVFLFVLVFFYFVSSMPIYSILFGIVIIAVASYLVYYAYRKKTINPAIFIEFKIIGGLISIMFLAFYISNISGIKKVLFPKENIRTTAFRYYEYNDQLDSLVSHTTAFKDQAFKKLSFSQISLRRINAKGRENALNVLNATYNTTSKLDLIKDNFSNADTILKSLTFNCLEKEKAIKGDFLKTYFESYNLDNYAHSVRTDGQDKIKEKWAALIRQVQYKGLLWLFVLIILSLCLWLQMSYRLADLKKICYPLASPTEEIAKVTDNIGQVKSLIYILLLLVLPFFRHIEKKDIDLSKPYLSFSLSNLSMGSYNSPSDNSGQGRGNSGANPTNSDSTISINGALMDSVSDLKQRIDILAAHTIQNADEYDKYLEIDSLKKIKK